MEMKAVLLLFHLLTCAAIAGLYARAWWRHRRGRPADPTHELRLACCYLWLVLVLLAELATEVAASPPGGAAWV